MLAPLRRSGVRRFVVDAGMTCDVPLLPMAGNSRGTVLDTGRTAAFRLVRRASTAMPRGGVA